MVKQNKKARTLFKNPAIWLGIVAGILYSSWPLGYLLNPSVAHTAYASQLEASSQPYNWLFIVLDIASGLALIMAGLIQWRRSKTKLAKLSVAGYLIFAALVVVAAIVPFDCNSLANSCTDALHSPLIIIHGLASTLSVVTLFVSVVIISKLLAGQKTIYKIKLMPLVMVFCWGLIGVLAAVLYHHADENLVQYGFISICSLSIIVSVGLIEYLHHLPHVKTVGEEA